MNMKRSLLKAMFAGYPNNMYALQRCLFLSRQVKSPGRSVLARCYGTPLWFGVFDQYGTLNQVIYS
jgi:hypothetical protein